MKIRYMSDLFVDLRADDIPLEKHGDVLCLCGNIGSPWKNRYASFVRRCAELFDAVFVIAGNTEFFFSDYDAVKA